MTLRPLIFFEIHHELPSHKLARVDGEVEALTEKGIPCQRSLFRQDSVPRALDVCVDVAIDESTTAFGEDGLPIAMLELMVGDSVTAVGRLDRRITFIRSVPDAAYRRQEPFRPKHLPQLSTLLLPRAARSRGRFERATPCVARSRLISFTTANGARIGLSTRTRGIRGPFIERNLGGLPKRRPFTG